MTWQARHRWMVRLLWLHVPALPLLGLVVGHGGVHALVGAGVAAGCALLATLGHPGRLRASLPVAVGLTLASAVVVHLGDGHTEAHFHFAAILLALGLYEEWPVFAAAVGLELLHHGLVGTVFPHEVYSHSDALAHPWKWSAIHGAFLVAVAFMALVSWRAAELSRLSERAAASAQLASQAEARRAWREALIRLARAIEFRDEDTGAHVERMADLSAAVARRAGLTEWEAERLREAATLHDAGKVAIPDAILFKPGPLNEEERRVLEQHPRIGYQLLSGSGSEQLQLAAEIAWTHHEWFDGSGYPRGLRGDQIPLAGRIAAVADVFDALTSPRPYRPAMSVAEALALMETERGTHFEPRLLDALILAVDAQVLAPPSQAAPFGVAPSGAGTPLPIPV